jgi:DNA-binding Xre family transcriptional regulator
VLTISILQVIVLLSTNYFDFNQPEIKHMNVMDVEEVSEALKDRKLNVVAEATGLTPNTLSEIKNGRATNPTIKTLKALSDYFNGTCYGDCNNE